MGGGMVLDEIDNYIILTMYVLIRHDKWIITNNFLLTVREKVHIIHCFVSVQF